MFILLVEYGLVHRGDCINCETCYFCFDLAFVWSNIGCADFHSGGGGGGGGGGAGRPPPRLSHSLSSVRAVHLFCRWEVQLIVQREALWSRVLVT